MGWNFKHVGIAIALVFAIMVGTYTSIRWYAQVAKWGNQAEREVFKESTAYNEAAASFLADAYKQYNDAKTEKDQKAIMEYVVMRYPNLDYNSIENRTLRNFYQDCIER